MRSPELAMEFLPPPPKVVDSLTGIIPFIAEVEMERSDPDVFVVASQIADTTVYGISYLPASSGSGAGLGIQVAYWAAVGETVERYACGILHPEDLIFGSSTELSRRGYRSVEPKRWTLFHLSQYNKVPFVPFQEDTVIGWVRAESLTHGEERIVPASLVYMPYHPYFTESGEQVIGYAISTGTACARSRAEALLKGICEVVERDAAIIVWRNRLACPRVHIDPQSALYPLFQERFARPGLEYTLVYTTLDLTIPSFLGILKDRRREPPGIIVGGAAHPDPYKAALKTLLELVQGLKWMDQIGYKPVQAEEGFRNIRSFDDRARLYAFGDMQEACQFFWENSHEIPLSSIPSLDTNDASMNWRRCCDLLSQCGLEVIALDLTPVDVLACGLHVIKVLIPECEPMEGDHRLSLLGGRRWREIPVQLGMRAIPADLEQLNPYPHPYP